VSSSDNVDESSRRVNEPEPRLSQRAGARSPNGWDAPTLGGPGPGQSSSEIRFGGQYVRITGPTSAERGTDPQTRESHEPPRLSPIMK
jgi:hypothetical protein